MSRSPGTRARGWTWKTASCPGGCGRPCTTTTARRRSSASAPRSSPCCALLARAERDGVVPGGGALAGVVGVRHHRHAHEPRRLPAAEPPVVVVEVARLPPPAADLSRPALEHEHARAVGVGIGERGALRHAAVPDIVDDGAGRILAVERPVELVPGAHPDPRLLRVVAEGHVDARGVVVAGLAEGIALLQHARDLPAPGDHLVHARVQVEGTIERGSGGLALRAEAPALAVRYHGVARMACDAREGQRLPARWQ